MPTKTCSKCNEIKELSEFYNKRNQCKVCFKEYQKEYHKEYYRNNKENKKEYNKEYYRNNKEYHKEYNETNSDKIKEYHKEYNKANSDKLKEYQKEYKKQRRKSDQLFKLRENLSSLIYKTTKNKGYSKSSKTQEIVGLDFQSLKTHLEYTYFLNYGDIYSGQEVHIDHIIPISTAQTEQELLKLNHWTNLQYLTPEDNKEKSDNLDWLSNYMIIKSCPV